VPQIQLPLTTVRVYKLYLLTYLYQCRQRGILQQQDGWRVAYYAYTLKKNWVGGPVSSSLYIMHQPSYCYF